MRSFIKRHQTALWTFVGVTLVLVLVIGLRKDPMSASELRVLLSGNTASGRTAEGSNYSVYYRSDGVMSGFAHSQHYYLGSWEVTDDGKFCRQWTKWQQGSRDCFDIYRAGENQFRMISGHPRREATFSVIIGDPEGLEYRVGRVGVATHEGSRSDISPNEIP